MNVLVAQNRYQGGRVAVDLEGGKIISILCVSQSHLEMTEPPYCPCESTAANRASLYKWKEKDVGQSRATGWTGVATGLLPATTIAAPKSRAPAAHILRPENHDQTEAPQQENTAPPPDPPVGILNGNETGIGTGTGTSTDLEARNPDRTGLPTGDASHPPRRAEATEISENRRSLLPEAGRRILPLKPTLTRHHSKSRRCPKTKADIAMLATDAAHLLLHLDPL